MHEDTQTETHTVTVMYQDGSRKEYTATWGSTDSKFTFGSGTASNPDKTSGIGLDVNEEKRSFGDAAPLVITVNLTTARANTRPANGPMRAAADPYAFQTVILLCNGKEIQRQKAAPDQTTVVFYVQTQAWTPGEYKFTATYGGDASTGSSITTDAETLNIVGQTLDESTLNLNISVSGTYGDKVSDLTASGTVT